jgi:predicted HTH transcriptional regulator
LFTADVSLIQYRIGHLKKEKTTEVINKMIEIIKNWTSFIVSDRVGIKYPEKVGEKEAETGLVDKGVDRSIPLSEKEQLILELIKQNPQISKEAIIEKSGLTKKAIEYNIEKLKKKGPLKRVGPAHGGHWEIIVKE